MGSTRLPGKVLQPLYGDVSMFEHLVNRCRKYPLCVAIPDQYEDDPIRDLCESLGVDYFQGSEEDVLSRTIQAAEASGFETVVRVTADNPFTLIGEFWNLTSRMQSLAWDYMSIYMDGQPAVQHKSGIYPEAVKLEALKRLLSIPDLSQSDREHVTLGIYTRRDQFRVQPVINRKAAEILKGKRYTVDTPEDLAFVRGLFEKNPPGFYDSLQSLSGMIRQANPKAT